MLTGSNDCTLLWFVWTSGNLKIKAILRISRKQCFANLTPNIMQKGVDIPHGNHIIDSRYTFKKAEKSPSPNIQRTYMCTHKHTAFHSKDPPLTHKYLSLLILGLKLVCITKIPELRMIRTYLHVTFV